MVAVPGSGGKTCECVSTAQDRLGWIACQHGDNAQQMATNEAIQMFGGIGMTDDEEIGFFLKRARVAQHTLGDYNYHLDRFARLNGF